MAVDKTDAVDISQAMVTEPVPLVDWLLIAPVLIPILAGAVLLMVRKRPAVQIPLSLASLVILVLVTGGLLARVMLVGPFSMTMGRWLPPFGISFVADGFGAVMAFAAAVVALCVGVYAASDISADERRYGFYPFLLLMMAGVCGAFLTGDIFNLYVWFEVLMIASFGLIVLGNRSAQLDGGIRYALLNLLATNLFLVAVGLLYGLLGTLNMAEIALKVRALDSTAPIYAITALFILAFAMKAAAFPVNFWLPASYHTPTISTSAIFAGLLTKVGVYALIRILILLLPVQHASYSDILVWVAILTMLTGSLGALAQSDFRRLSGYLVISGIGVIMSGVAVGTEFGIAGAILYALHSMIVMTALYLAIGLVARNAGSFDFTAIGGLYANNPVLAAFMLVLTFSIAGLPPFSGLWPKILLTQAALVEGRWILGAVILLTGLFTVLALGRAFAQSFWREAPQSENEAGAIPAAQTDTKATSWLLGPLGVLVALTALFGIWPAPLVDIAGDSTIVLFSSDRYIEAVFPPSTALPVGEGGGS